MDSIKRIHKFFFYSATTFYSDINFTEKAKIRRVPKTIRNSWTQQLRLSLLTLIGCGWPPDDHVLFISAHPTTVHSVHPLPIILIRFTVSIITAATDHRLLSSVIPQNDFARLFVVYSHKAVDSSKLHLTIIIFFFRFLS